MAQTPRAREPARLPRKSTAFCERGFLLTAVWRPQASNPFRMKGRSRAFGCEAERRPGKTDHEYSEQGY